MPITLSPETEARWVQAAAKLGMDPEEWLLSNLEQAESHIQSLDSTQADDVENHDWWNTLTEEERQAEIAAIREGIDAGVAGKAYPANEVYARVRASVQQSVVGSVNQK